MRTGYVYYFLIVISDYDNFCCRKYVFSDFAYTMLAHTDSITHDTTTLNVEHNPRTFLK